MRVQDGDTTTVIDPDPFYKAIFTSWGSQSGVINPNNEAESLGLLQQFVQLLQGVAAAVFGLQLLNFLPGFRIGGKIGLLLKAVILVRVQSSFILGCLSQQAGQ